MAKLGDICTKITDGSHNPPQGISHSEYLMLSSKNIYDDEITLDDPRYLSAENYAIENKRTQISTGDILLTIVGTVGRAAVVSDSIKNICLQRSVAVIKPKSNLIDSRFLMYQLQSMRTHLEQEARGVAQKGIYLKQVESLQVKVPSMDEQLRVVKKLDKVSKLIILRKEQLAKLDELVKSRFIELFGNRGKNPFNYPTTTMGNVYKFQYGKGNNIPEDKGEYPCYGSNGVVGHHTEYNSEDSPIIGHIGAYAGIVNWGKGKHYVTYNGVICKLINDQVNPVYGYYLLQIQDYNTVAKSGAAQPFVSYKDLDAPIVNVPPLELQNQFAAFVEQTDKSKLAIQQSLNKLETLKKSLMQEYFG